MGNIINALFIGSLASIFLMIVFYAGINKNYLEYHGIFIFFNSYFIHIFDYRIFLTLLIAFGGGFFLFGNSASIVFGSLYVLLLITSSLMFYQPFGNKVGFDIFGKNYTAIELNNSKKIEGILLINIANNLFILEKNQTKPTLVANKMIKK